MPVLRLLDLELPPGREGPETAHMGDDCSPPRHTLRYRDGAAL